MENWADSWHTHLEVLPPVLALEFGRAGFKLRGSGLQSVRAVIQLGQLLISFQNLVYIHTHNIHHLEGGEQTLSAHRP